MTYCIATVLNEGLVLTSDSRTNAGIDSVSIYSKMHLFTTAADRRLILLSAGNLATTQAVLEQLRRDIENADINLNTMDYLSEAATYLGKVSVDKQRLYANRDAQASGFNPTATFILAGQIGQGQTSAYLIYPEGNSITTSPQTPYLQIGESKYGRPVLDRFLTMKTSLEEAARCCLISMDSTMRSNVSVGSPIEVLLYRKDSLRFDEYYCFDADNSYMVEIRQQWGDKLKQVFLSLPPLDKRYVMPLPNH
jgi:putative proteasome-type protease